jgi:hypothetical protein
MEALRRRRIREDDLGRNVVPKRKWRRNYVDLVKGI